MSYVLGVSSYYHDSAAALLRDGEIISAVQEERFSRIKHDASFPAKSITYILKEYKLSLSDIDYIAFYDKPFLKFERILETCIENWPRGFSSFKHSIAIWIKEKLFLKNLLVKELKKIDPGCKLKNDIFIIDSKLVNKNFIEQAPKQVIDEQKSRKLEIESFVERLNLAINRLENKI